MDRKIMLWIVIGVLFLTVLFVAFRAGAGTSNLAVNTANAVQSASSSGAMVGGC